MGSRDRSLLGSPTVQTILLFVGVYVVSSVLWAVYEPLFYGLFVLHEPLTHPWTLVTSIYAHAGIAHLVGNAAILALVGIPLERSTTTAAYHAYFVATGVVAGLFQILIPESVAIVVGLVDLLTLGFFDLSHSGAVPALGASGAVLAVAGYVLTGNRLSRGILKDVPSPIQWAIVVVLSLGVTVWLSGAGVANIAHFFGIFVGLIAGAIGVLPSRERSGNASY